MDVCKWWAESGSKPLLTTCGAPPANCWLGLGLFVAPGGGERQQVPVVSHHVVLEGGSARRQPSALVPRGAAW